MAMSPEQLHQHRATLARLGMTYTEPFGPTDMSDAAVKKRMREVAAKAVEVPSIFNEQNDFDLGNQVRMLTRHDSGHEGVVCAARDRIFQLSLKVAALTHALEMVRDADDDCKRDGEGGALPIPPIARATVDKALGGAR